MTSAGSSSCCEGWFDHTCLTMTRPLRLDDIYRLPVPSDAQLSPAGDLIAFVVTTPDRSSDSYRSQVCVLSTDRAVSPSFSPGPRDSSPRWSPDGAYLAFIGHDEAGLGQIWLLPTEGGDSRQLICVDNGVSDICWSPDGREIAFVATVGPIPHPNSPRVVSTLQYKADGIGLFDSRPRHLFACNLDGATRTLSVGMCWIRFPVWSPDGALIAIAASWPVDDTVGRSARIALIPSGGGAAVGISPEMYAADCPSWSPDGQEIAFVGKLNAEVCHYRLFLASRTGSRLRDLSHPLDRNIMTGAPAYPGAPPRFTADGNGVAFCARDQGCVDVYFLSLREPRARPEKIIGDGGCVVTGFSLAVGRIAFLRATPRSTGEICLRSLKGGEIEVLADPCRDGLEGVEVAIPESRVFAAPDGGSLQGWLLGPPDVSRAPLLVDVHGGPRNAWNPALDPSHLYQHSLVASGWRVLLLNPSGSDGYGEAFFTSLDRTWGRSDADEILMAIDELVRRGLVDENRIAVTGYSYGGFMANWLVSRSRRFAAAVVGGSICNLLSFCGTADHGYDMLPFQFQDSSYAHPESLTTQSPITYVENVRTPTLILHGEVDYRCPISQAEEWFTALRGNGVHVEFVRYPSASHLFIINGRPSYRFDYARRLEAWVQKYVESRTGRSGTEAGAHGTAATESDRPGDAGRGRS